MKQRGFSLVELAVALTIIGLLIGAIFQGQSLIDAARVDTAVSKAQDLAAAVTEFKKRYRLYPGDMPAPPVTGLIAGCTAGGNGNGQIDAAESACVVDVLNKAGLIGFDDIVAGIPVVRSHYGTITVRSTALSQTVAARGSNPFVPSASFVTELANTTCEAARHIDRKLDDSVFSTGNTIASVDACVVGGANDPVPFIAIAF
jgi:prepilin-type N-terminal cleavage/methylation domain-containing protein